MNSEFDNEESEGDNIITPDGFDITPLDNNNNTVVDDSIFKEELNEILEDVDQIIKDIDGLFGMESKLAWADLEFVTLFNEKDDRRELVRAILHDNKTKLGEFPFLWNICRVLVTSIDVINADMDAIVDKSVEFSNVDENLITFFDDFIEGWATSCYEPIKDKILRQYWNPTDESCKTELGTIVLSKCHDKQELDDLLLRFYTGLYNNKLHFCLISFYKHYGNCKLDSIDTSTAQIHDNKIISFFGGSDAETKEKVSINLE